MNATYEEEEMSSGDWLTVAYDVQRLEPEEKLVLIVLASYVGQDGVTGISKEVLSRVCCMPVESIDKVLTRLEFLGLIRIGLSGDKELRLSAMLKF